MKDNRQSVSAPLELITDPAEKARREVENGVRQFNQAVELIREHVRNPERPFRLRSSHILMLHKAAMEGIHQLAGTFRNTSVAIRGSRHQPPEAFLVAEHVEHLCTYVNENWDSNALHLTAYVLWRLNWIHPFADGNGRTSRVVSYGILNIKSDSILPGSPTIPEQIAANKRPYYEALELADDAWAQRQEVDVTALEAMLDSYLAKQLVNAAEAARGED